jgi:CHAT domain-containing protein
MQQGRFAAALELYSELRRQSFDDAETQEFARFAGSIGVAATYAAMGHDGRSKAIIDNDPVIRLLADKPCTSLARAFGLMFVGALQSGLERHYEASLLLEEALPTLRETLGAQSYVSLTTAGLLGSTKFKIGQKKEARKLLSETVENAKLAGLSDTFEFNFAQAELAKVLDASGQLEESRLLIGEAVDAIINRLNSANQSQSVGSITERRRAKEIFSTYIDVAGKEAESTNKTKLEKTFAVAQYATSLSVDEAIRNWTHRADSADPELADFIQRLSIAQDVSRSLDRQYQHSILSNALERQAIAKQLSNVDAEIRNIRAAIGELGFRAADLTESQPVSIGDIQVTLDSNELLLVYMTAKDKGYGWSISSTNAAIFEIKADRSTLRQKIDSLRASLVPEVDGGINVYLNDVAHWLYDNVVKPGLAGHPQATKLIIVPDGPLIGVPFSALRLSELPLIDDAGTDNGWLNTHYAVSLAPSVSSLRSLRTRVSASQAKIAFLGFGDPILGQSPDRSNRQLESYSAYYDTRGLGDLSQINSLVRLPETADELRELALLLDGSEGDIYLGQDATETKFKKLELHDFRVLAFATHGLLAGSIVGHGEPALVLTPPLESSTLDDGLLTASEIATLKLDADLVILSACDTAAGGADADAMGLSGLARAFFLAGTRNVLASNWPVNSDAARQLTTMMFESIKANPDLSYPEALQLAMLDVQASAETELARHPVYWAPFVVIGQ